MSSGHLERSVEQLARIRHFVYRDDDSFASGVIADIRRLANGPKIRIELDAIARQYTLVALARLFGGVAAACHDLIHSILMVDRDIQRSVMRFSRNAFWETSVPMWVGATTLLTSVVTAWLDGLLIP